jgi:hypothetical protein
MNEHVRSAVVWRDEAEALGGVEELHGSNGHDDFPFQSALSLVIVEIERKIVRRRSAGTSSTSKIEGPFIGNITDLYSLAAKTGHSWAASGLDSSTGRLFRRLGSQLLGFRLQTITLFALEILIRRAGHPKVHGVVRGPPALPLRFQLLRPR